jgi:AcrR family transcriptional regulator
MVMKAPLREIKKVRSKISIFRATLELIGNKSFKEVRLEEICEKAEVSKVTFFKFFPRKEDVLVYFMRLWLTDRIIELKQHPKRGLNAIRLFLQSVADGAKEKPGLMLSLISFLAEENMHPHMPVLSDAEIQILYPGIEELVDPEVPDLGELFYQFLVEAKEDGEITVDLSAEELVKIMFSIFYGAYLTAHMYQSKDIMSFYELHLKPLTM